ncbi:MAG: hypothetical protein IJE08_05880 [Clostridia bacterium]|nr:hypothetical protein [Clostridia bacterium]
MRMVYSMNPGWKFRKAGEIHFDLGGDNDFDMFSGYTKTGAMVGPASDSFSDADWDEVCLPHDWAVSEPFVENGAQGGKPRGAAWYRKCFHVPAEWEGKRVFIRFDGIACRSAVMLNNVRIASSESTYTPVSAEITELLHYGQPNQLAVVTDNKQGEGWWYDGCGIYRDVWLTVTGESRIVEDGAFVHAEKDGDAWTLSARVEVDRPETGARVVVSVMGKTAACAAGRVSEVSVIGLKPELWSLDCPKLYDVSVRIISKTGEVLDEEIIPFGFRTVAFDVNRGCIVNGEPVKLKGVCIHHDHAGVGAAVTDDLNYYRVKRLKEMGCNAIRTSHNPQSPGLYRACDELGVALMAEVRHFGSTQEELRQLRAMVRRDRNHAGVFFWSLFNEEPLQCSKQGEMIARTMKRVVDEEDGTRPVSGGMNGPLECEGAVKVVDVMGFNYLQYGYDDFHKWFPDMPIVGSETASHLTGRGEAANIVTDTVLHRSSFGRQHFMPGDRAVNLYSWSDTPGGTWKKIEERPFVAGGYQWTGFDYRGEANWPGVIADFGAMDLCGFPKDNFYWNQALWLDEDVLYAARYQVPGEKQATLVVHTNGNRISVKDGDREPVSYEFDKFDPPLIGVSQDDEIIVSAFRGEKKIGEMRVVKPGKAAGLFMECTGRAAHEGGATAFNVYLRDENGRIVDANDVVRFSSEGGTVLGVGNGDTCSHEKEVSDTVRLYHGCAQVIVRAGRAERMTVSAVCGSFEAEVKVPVIKSRQETIPACRPWLRICPWRMSDVHDTYPIPSQIHDMIYNWIPTMAGVEKSLMMSGKHGYACFAGFFSAPDAPSEIHLENVRGIFDLYMDGEKILSCADHELHSYVLPINPSLSGKRCALSLVFTCDGGEVCVGETYLTDAAPVIDTRCGLSCAECTYRESCGCGGCIATNGHPFHGECPVAQCCQEKGWVHCGQCDAFPCELLTQYSCDPEHGDNPPGARIEVCRAWRMERKA